MFNWEKLNEKNQIIDKIVFDWKNLLDDCSLNESVYHKYLYENSGLFFHHNNSSYLTISKLKLGSEYEVDFVNLIEGDSRGLLFEFVEIESPSDKVFTKKKIPSHELICSMQQIRNWKRWLIDNKSYFRKFLPTGNTRVIRESNITYTLIIGRRDSMLENQDERNQIMFENGIQIRSFDYLTDMCKKRFYSNRTLLFSSEMEHVPLAKEDELANPFYMAMSDSEWKDFCYKKIDYCHFYALEYVKILRFRKYSRHFDEFLSKYYPSMI